MECLHCHQPKPIKYRGLCRKCHRAESVRNKYPSARGVKPRDESRPACVHCKVRNGNKHRCSLCIRCYQCIGIRKQYRTDRNYKGANGDGGMYRGPTLAQLEALIESRYPTMPNEPKPPRAPSEPLAVRRMIRTGKAGMVVRKTSSEW